MNFDNTRIGEMLNAAEVRQDSTSIKAILVAGTLARVRLFLLKHSIPESEQKEVLRDLSQAFFGIAPEIQKEALAAVYAIVRDTKDIGNGD